MSNFYCIMWFSGFLYLSFADIGELFIFVVELFRI